MVIAANKQQQVFRNLPLYLHHSQLWKKIILMHYIVYSKSRFLRFFAHSKIMINEHRCEFIDFQKILLEEVEKNAEFRKEFLNDMESGQGTFTEKRMRHIWKSILTSSFDAEFVFLNINFPERLVKSLIKVSDELDLKFDLALNLFLTKDAIVKEAKLFLESYESSEELTEEESIDLIISDEQKRLSLFKEFESTIEVINIAAEGTTDEVEMSISHALQSIIEN